MTGENNRPFEHEFPAPGILQSKHRYPWLVYLHGERRQNQTFCDLSSSSSDLISKSIPEFRDRKVLYCSPDGNWLLMLQKKNRIGSKQRFFLWSPPRDLSIRLPRLRQDLQGNTIHQGLVTSPDPNSILVLLFVTEIPLMLYCHVGDQNWCEFNYAQSIEAQAGRPVRQVMDDGQQPLGVPVCGMDDEQQSSSVCGMDDEQQSSSVSVSPLVDSPIDLNGKSNTTGFLNDKRRRSRKQSKRERTSLCDVSAEVLGLISGKLPLVDYMYFRGVSKHCASGNIGMRMNPFPPSLIYKDKLSDVYNIVDSNLNRKLAIKTPKVLERCEIACSRFGWLLLRSQLQSAFFNPLTIQVVPAGGKPESTAGYGILNSTFLRKPSSPHCSILAMLQFTTRGKSYFAKRSPQPRKPEWQVFGLGKQGLRRVFSPGGSSPVFLGEFCYYLGDNGILGRGKLTKKGKPPFCWKVLEDLVFPVVNFRHNYLTESGGELVSVLLGDDDQGNKPWVRVFKLKDEKTWEEINSLEGYCLYLSSPSSISCLAETPEVANRIYFPMFYRHEMVYYSLNTKTYRTAGSDQELQTLNETSTYLDCAWIEPSWT
ncbi:OLC1v1022737C1 [Oldenlandia corymbosa var. corymbosa]|uniref:OLC1v1022737C1 n=1 Tax=Oldenlandia corymbosa var. corymbosa TaxID=529605 RepID=A0AAV1BYG8_OLDCO|nr:OLC1v1022737C1 [Oldenlandia corymbosa var. corymbosa]